MRTTRARGILAPGHWIGLARVVALVSSDALALLVTGLLACLLWVAGVHGLPAETGCGLIALVPVFTASYALAGLYPGFGVSAIQLIRTTTRQTTLVVLIIASSLFAFQLEPTYSRGALALWWALALVAVPLVRLQVSTLVASLPWWREPILLMGCRDSLEGLIASLARARHLGYRPVAVVLTEHAPGNPPASIWKGLPVLSEADAIAAARHLGVRTVLLTAGATVQNPWTSDLRDHFRHVISVHSIEDRYVEPTAIRYLGSSIGIDFQNHLLMRRNQAIKRAADLALAWLGLLLTLPGLCLAAVLIVLVDPGPWWHVQQREGRGGHPFRIWKLRTMYRDADARLEAHLASDPAARAEWHREFKLTRDPRVLPGVGAMLRRWSLDECPQFWNVIRGEMSLVGPRALPVYHLAAFDGEFRLLRQRVRPGMTGMWQVMSRGTGAIGTQEALDRYYIYNWSIWLDLFIISRTVLAVISGRGAR